jgi:membrane fusion protein, multidrug efflux system
MSATGLAAARLIESPKQLAARSAAPAASAITGVARMRVLRDGFVLPGVVEAGKTVTVAAAAPYRTVVVTKMPVKAGQKISPGHVIAQLDGRPVILLRGKLPAYRDLRVGDTGPDVTQLQAALTSLGYSDFDERGYFGPSTALAVETLFEHFGYRVPLYTPRARKSRANPTGIKPPPEVYLPMSDVCFIPTASAIVITTTKAGSSLAAGQAVTRLATGPPYVTGVLSAHQVALARTGSAARIRAGNRRRSTDGVLTAIAAIPAGPRSAQPQFPVTITTDKALPENLIGTTVRLTLWSTVTTEPVLSVPVTAVFSGQPAKPASSADQTSRSKTPASYVVVVAHRRTLRVPVFTGQSADGFIAIQPATAGAVAAGDQVLIGTGP